MRNFLIAGNVAYGSGSDLNSIAEGAIAVVYNKNGVLTITDTGKEITRDANIVIGRKAENGGPIVQPIYKNRFSYNKAGYIAASTFECEFTVENANKLGDYTVIIAKKGVPFNKRNKYSITVHIKDMGLTAEELADKLVAAINNSEEIHNIIASNDGGKITLKCNTEGIDYAIILTDGLSGINNTIKKIGSLAQGDIAYVKKLMNICAANMGFEYTDDKVHELYPNYDKIPGYVEGSNFNIYNITFKEPSTSKRLDNQLKQLLQIAIPTNSPAIATFEKVLNQIAFNQDDYQIGAFAANNVGASDESDEESI